ncbi:MAG: OB-fold nucleic acid binding domain-containing protein [Eubacterium sp.]|nr:OB-fold nucleic acid binding domain-containing protein [Eubacterium sp.]
MKKRTHHCGELRLNHAGEEVRLAGWYENLRKVSKSLGFMVLRDFYGTTQVVVEDERLMEQLSGINRESTLEIVGTVRERSSKNKKLATGEVEVVPSQITVLGKCKYSELPFPINRSKESDENTRLKYRYLDLRNPEVKLGIVVRSKVVADLRKAMNDYGFMEITTPILTASSPEGARDYLVPARNHPGKFYALPQAPQQFKQLLMASGFDRYFQIASGAVRNHDPEIMVKAFEVVGLGEEDVKEKFPALYHAFCYGAPPHAGIAPGIDRMLMLIRGEERYF